jgi:CheY-like chemotaxis protein
MKRNEILVVDDDIIAQNMLRTTLSGVGYSVAAASNGMEGIKLAAERQPRLIVLDIMMPDIDGGEVADILRKDQKTMNIPVIFLSSLVSGKRRKGRRQERYRLFFVQALQSREAAQRGQEISVQGESLIDRSVKIFDGRFRRV